MNVYDQAHNLTRAIKESEEFKQFDQQKKIIDGNPQMKSMIDDFMKQQFEIQTKQMMGEEPDSETMAKMQQSMAIIMADPTAANYIQCQMRFSLMMQDVFNILNEVIGPMQG